MSKQAFAATALALAVAACGGGGDGGSDAAPSPSASTPSAVQTTTLATPSVAAMTKADWVTAVNKVCTKVTDGSDAIQNPETADDYLAAMTTLHELMETSLTELAELPPPAADAADVEKYLVEPQQRRVQTLEAALPSLESAAQADDKAAAEKAFGEALLKADPDVQEQERWMAGYGLDECVE